MAITLTLQGSLARSTDTERQRYLRTFNIPVETDEEASFRWIVPTGTPDAQFDFGLVDDAQMLVLFSTYPIKIRLSPGGEQIDVRDMFVIIGGVLNQLFISNDSGNEAEVEAYIGGKPAAP